MRLIRVLFLFLFFILSIAIAKNQIVYFEQAKVTLAGDILILKFPGPPNYESIKNGDKEEKGPYLILASPIDIELKSNSKANGNESQKNVKLLQLIVLNDSDWKNLKEGNYVRVT